jgi:hypothetical protein
VSNKSLVTVANDPIRYKKFPAQVTIHGRLATYLALKYQRNDYSDKDNASKPWQDVWPTREEFETILPIHWPQELQKLLPDAAKGINQILEQPRRHSVLKYWQLSWKINVPICRETGYLSNRTTRPSRSSSSHTHGS